MKNDEGIKLCGVLNINKPLGITSFDVVRQVKRLAREKKVGHGGTLDPEAAGVLPVCIGRATKAIDFIMDNHKEYIAELKLGVITDTYDREGKILKEMSVTCSEEQVINAVKKFTGTIDQIPPMYSALKVNGKKLYELARQGIEVERQSRPVTIDNIEVLSMELSIVKIKVNCSKGTYIRSLCYDIGNELGCGAMMWSLTRTATGPFDINNSVDLQDLTEENIGQYLLPLEKVFEKYKVLRVNQKFERLLINGVAIQDKALVKGVLENIKYAVYSESEVFIGIGTLEEKGFKLTKLFI